MSLTLASIHIYPIKSLGGIALPSSQLTDRGLQHDRRWMLVDADGRFLSQRELPVMACLHCEAMDGGFRVRDLRDGGQLELAWQSVSGTTGKARIWSDEVEVIHAPTPNSAWFAERLGCNCSLVYMPDTAQRPMDARYAQGLTMLSDDFPYLIISQASLVDLNTRMVQPVPMDRFRPNLVIAGGSAFQEDGWTNILIGDARFSLVKPCARCVVTTTDQLTGVRDKEPLRTLATYRSVDNKVMFGMNAVGDLEGSLRVGDLVAPFLL